MARRSSSQPSGLSRERILEVALGIARAEGVDALSMRRLAQELDVWPMSVYRYFEDKDALLDAMAAGVAGGVRRPARRGSWRTQLHALLGDMERSISASPGVSERLPRGFLTPEALRLSETGMAILTGAGFPAREAAGAWRALYSYTFGFATFRIDSRRRVRTALTALPEEDYPTLAGAVDEVTDALASDDEFSLGLDRILDTLERRLDAAAVG